MNATVLHNAGVIAAAMMLACGLIDCVNERWSHRGVRFCLNLAIISSYMATLQYLLH